MSLCERPSFFTSAIFDDMFTIRAEHHEIMKANC